MSAGVRDLTAILRLDLAETIRSRWALFCVALALILWFLLAFLFGSRLVFGIIGILFPVSGF